MSSYVGRCAYPILPAKCFASVTGAVGPRYERGPSTFPSVMPRAYATLAAQGAAVMEKGRR